MCVNLFLKKMIGRAKQKYWLTGSPVQYGMYSSVFSALSINVGIFTLSWLIFFFFCYNHFLLICFGLQMVVVLRKWKFKTVYAYKRLFCNDVCSTLVKMFVCWKDPVNKKNISVF